MSLLPHIHAQLEHNVKVQVRGLDAFGKPCVRASKCYKNTATRLMTQSICEYLAGDENTYNRGHGRPNFMSFGTMGIIKQPNLVTITAENQYEYLEPQFSDKNPPAQDRTRPWFESTSLALTTTCGDTVQQSGTNPHFWNPEYGWGTAATPDSPTFQGELCTAMDAGDAAHWAEKGWTPIERIPISRADVITDCPQDLDYGSDGYSSATIFYGFASVNWVNSILTPQEKNPDAGRWDPQEQPVGPQLDRIAISEFGLFERSNLDPNGLCTMMAGFRVASPEDIIYVQRNEVILIEWRVTVRALMPYECVQDITETT